MILQDYHGLSLVSPETEFFVHVNCAILGRLGGASMDKPIWRDFWLSLFLSVCVVPYRSAYGSQLGISKDSKARTSRAPPSLGQEGFGGRGSQHPAQMDGDACERQEGGRVCMNSLM